VDHKIDGAFDLKRLRHVLKAELEVRVSAQMFDIALSAREEIIQRDDPDVLLQQAIAHMRSYKSRCSGNHGTLINQNGHNFECSTM
jgi:hypothetical protein